MDEQLALGWIGIGIAIVLAILIYRLINYIAWKIRFKRSCKRMRMSILAAAAQMDAAGKEGADAGETLRKLFDSIMRAFSNEIGYLTGRWISRNLPKFIKEVKRNERTRKNGDGRSSQGEPTKY